METGLRYLNNMEQSDILIQDPNEKKARVKAVISTLIEVVSDILTSPFEPEFRKLPKNAKNVKDKIMAHPNAVNFLKLAGFKFDEPGKNIVMIAYSKEELEECLYSLKLFAACLGRQVKDPLAFDPFKAGLITTSGVASVPSDAEKTGYNKISSAQQEIASIRQQREAELEDTVEDREIQIYNQKASVASQSMNTNQFLAMMEKRQEAEAASKARAVTD